MHAQRHILKLVKKWAKYAFYGIVDKGCIFLLALFLRGNFLTKFLRVKIRVKSFPKKSTFFKISHFCRTSKFFDCKFARAMFCKRANSTKFFDCNFAHAKFCKKGGYCRNFLIAILPTQNFPKKSTFSKPRHFSPHFHIF